MRFKAPPHVTSAHLSIGELQVDEDGFVEVPLDTPTTDIGGLRANGFTPAPTDDPASTSAQVPAKSKQPLDLTSEDEAENN